MSSGYHSYIDSIKYKNTENIKYIFISGWCFQEEKKDFDYFCQINNQKKFPVEINTANREDVQLKFSEFKIDRSIGFSTKIKLNESLQKFRLFVKDESNNEKDLISLNEKQLSKYEDIYPFEHNIEGFQEIDGRGNVSGWAYSIDKKPLQFEIVDENRVILTSERQSLLRKDLVLTQNIGEDQLSCGFAISFDLSNSKRYYLRIIYQENAYDIPISTSKGFATLTKAYIREMNSENIKKAFRYLKNHGVSDFFKRLSKGPSTNELTYVKWFEYHKVTPDQLEIQRNTTFKFSPKISLIVATYNTPTNFLKEMIDSVINQSYSNWELCIGDGSTNDSVFEYVSKHYQNDSRIKIKKLEKNYGIAGNMNGAYELATGDYIGLYDHDDLLTPDALYEIVKVLQQKKYDMVYTDEDKYLTVTKEFADPHFKPDFNIDLLCSVNYICHFLVVSKKMFDITKGFDSEFDGAQDYDFILRCVEATTPENIYHIPKILYHWRMHSLSTASNPESKLYAFEAGKRAIQAHFDRLGVPATVESGEDLGIYHVKFILDKKPMISILIPNKDHIEDLKKCIDSIENKSTYGNYEYIIIENNSTEAETFEFYRELEKKNEKVHVVYWKEDFNYSAINNFGEKYAKGDYILLLNNDTEIINEDCLEELVGYCQQENVGAVGARLFYEDDTIQHAGVIVGLGGIAGHCFVGRDKKDTGYFNRILCAQDYSAVTAACMMVKKEAFDKVEGLYEGLKVAFNDIDFCMKLRQAGYLIVYNPYAMLHHYESKSRGLEDSPEKVKRFNREIDTFAKRWPDILKNGDPFYNPNLSLMKEAYDLKPLEEEQMENEYV